MQTDESRQEVLTTAKVNLAVANTTLTVVVNLRIKWRQEQSDLARCNENPFLLQRKYVVLTLLDHEILDIKGEQQPFWVSSKEG